VTPKPVAPRISVPAWLSWAVREHELSPATFAVLFTLCELGDDEWVCTESAAKIAQHCGVARSATQKALARLIEIQAIVPLGEGPRSRARTYRVSASRPPTAAQLRLLATPATRRAVQGGNGWLVSVD
jgi:hypothetical protein